MFMLNSNEPIKAAYLQKLVGQSMLNGTLVIEMTNNSLSEKHLSFHKARNVLIEKKNRYMGSEKYISIRFQQSSKLIRRAKEQQSY